MAEEGPMAQISLAGSEGALKGGGSEEKRRGRRYARERWKKEMG